MISVIVDGQTEKWYLDLMKSHEDIPRIAIKPELPKKKKIGDIKKLVVDLSKDYDQVVWIVDFDTILSESKQTKKGHSSPLQEFEKIKKDLDKIANVDVLVNTPCLEFWMLLHFKYTGSFSGECRSVKSELKNHLKDYDKTQKYYKNPRSNIYKKLKPKQNEAIKNGTKLGRFDFGNPESAKAEMFLLFEILELA